MIVLEIFLGESSEVVFLASIWRLLHGLEQSSCVGEVVRASPLPAAASSVGMLYDRIAKWVL